MNALSPGTSGIGPMLRYSAFIGIVTVGVCSNATASVNRSCLVVERTTAGPTGNVIAAQTGVARSEEFRQAESVADAILEIRRLASLTWEEISNLFTVSIRSVHHWANGKPAKVENQRAIRKVLAVLRRVNTGNSAQTRDILLSPAKGEQSMFDLLAAQEFTVASKCADGMLPAPIRPALAKLSQAAHDARRPPAPTVLFDALQDRPAIESRGRLVQVIRSQKRSG